jgi:hypothetical protein
MFVGCHRMTEKSGVGMHNPFRIEFILLSIFYRCFLGTKKSLSWSILVLIYRTFILFDMKHRLVFFKEY